MTRSPRNGPAAAAVNPGLTHDIARIAAQPLWFLAVYLLVTLIALVVLVGVFFAVLIGIPSFKLLYYSDVVPKAEMTSKMIWWAGT